MKIFTRKPPAEGALTLAASAVHLMRLGGERIRLVDVPDDQTVKIRPHKGTWPLITCMGEMDDYPHAEESVTIYAVETEDKPGWRWHFAADTSLTVLLGA